MKLGTPGFVGPRLREAREGRGLTAMSLAELLGITRSAISYYEKGTTSPQPDVMERIATTLNLKPEFFLRPITTTAGNVIFERSMASATKGIRLRARRRHEWVTEIVHFLCQYVLFPQVNFPSIGIGERWRSMHTSEIEEIETDVRRFWNLGDGPISNVTLLLENNGAIVTRTEMGADNLDAFSTWALRDKLPYIVLGTDKGSAVRSRYDVAHELGHLVLHDGVDQARLAHTVDFKLIEDQAHRFAGAFLTPATTFAKDLLIPTLDAFRALKSKWLVSIKMMIHRTHDLGIIHNDQARKMYISYNRRYGAAGIEPMDDRLQPEEPRLLRRAFETIVDGKILERSQIVAELPFNRVDVEDLAGLPYGYLDDESPYVWAINALTPSP